jgi:colanic acid/amylovoran biosynthesis glycosyltransferase
MPSLNKTIGLIIPSPIGYSETFFSAKVMGLMNAGFRIIIFCAKKQNSDSNFEYVYQWPLAQNPFLRTIQLLLGLLRVSFHPRKVLTFFRLQKKAGDSTEVILKGLYINGHLITGPRLDFLHFGFATMAIGRETMGKVLECKLSTSFRGYDVAIYPTKHGSDCYRRLWQNLDKVHTISDDLLTLAYEKLALPKSIPVSKITPAIDTKKFILASNRRFITEGELKILSIGRLHWKKGYEYALVALKELKEAGISFQYTLVGSGEDLERICFARKQLGLEKEVEILGKIPHNEVPVLMKEYDIFLQPSIQEGFGNAVLEAQAAGMLCIVSNAEGLAENVLHQKTGWVVPKSNATALANQIIEVVNMPAHQLTALSAKAQQRAREDFDISTQISSFVQFYTQ